MGITTKQLETIFAEINERFKNNPYISITPGDSGPPGLEVTYTIKGLHLNKNHEVHEATQHSIAITLPFGFPPSNVNTAYYELNFCKNNLWAEFLKKYQAQYQ